MTRCKQCALPIDAPLRLCDQCVRDGSAQRNRLSRKAIRASMARVGVEIVLECKTPWHQDPFVGKYSPLMWRQVPEPTHETLIEARDAMVDYLKEVRRG